MAVNIHFYDRDVKTLLEKVRRDLSLGCTDYLGNSKKQLGALRDKMYHFRRDSSRIANQYKELGDAADQVDARLEELNRSTVTNEVELALSLVSQAQEMFDNPPLHERVPWIVRRINDYVRQAILLLIAVGNDRYLKPYLAKHGASIMALRAVVERFEKCEDISQAIANRQAECLAAEAALRKKDRVMEAARARQEQEENARVVAQQSEYARTAFTQFHAAIEARDLDAANSAYNMFASYGAKYGPGVYATCLGRQDPEMYFGRMWGMMRTLKDDEVGATKVRDLVG